MSSIQSQLSNAQRRTLELLNIADSLQYSMKDICEFTLPVFWEIVDNFRYPSERIQTDEPEKEHVDIIRKLMEKEIEPHEATALITKIWSDFLNKTRRPGEPVVKPNKYRSEPAFSII